MNAEDDRGSSPDPLTVSWNSSHAIRPSVSPNKPSANSSHQKPKYPRRTGASNAANSSEAQRQTLIFTTPTKEAGRRIRADSSPWKIKVTVQAEQEDESIENEALPQIKTTKVPLRGGDERGNVRRKSSKARSSRSDTSSDPTSPDPGTQKKRNGTPGRKRKQPVSNLDETAANEPMPEDASDLIGLNTPRSTQSIPSKRKKSDIRSQSSSKPQDLKKTKALPDTPLHEKSEYAHLARGQFEVDHTPFGQRGEPSAKRKLRERVPTPRKPAGFDESDLSSVPDSTPVASQSCEESEDPQQRLLFNATLGPTDDDDTKQELNLESEDEDVAAVDDLEDDTRVLDQSLAESEGFTMVSIHSLQSQNQTIAESQTHMSSNVVRHAFENELEGNGEEVRSGSVVQRVSKSEKIQDMNAPSGTFNKPEAEQQIDIETPQSRNPFGGFGDGTRRALSAGLAMGELLARSQPGFAYRKTGTNDCNKAHRNEDKFITSDQGHGRLPTPSDTASSSGTSFRHSSEEERVSAQCLEELTGRDKADNVINHQVVKTEDSMMSWRPSTPTKVIAQSPELTRSQDFERQWQIERDEVIRQAENLNSSQVIYIESGSTSLVPFSGDIEEQEDSEMGDVTDIWQEEAERSLEEYSHVDDTRTSHDTEQEQEEQTPDLKELFGEDTRPLRSKLPRTWRRTSGNHFLYSDEAESPIRPLPIFEQVIGEKQEKNSKFTKEKIQRDDPVQSGSQEIDLKTILSSPQRRSLGLDSTPKEVRFKNTATEYPTANAESVDEQYFSREVSADDVTTEAEEGSSHYYRTVNGRRLTNGDKDYLPKRHDGEESLKAQTTGLSQLQKDLKTLATPKGRILMNDPNSYAENSPYGNRSMLVLNPKSNKTYVNLFGDSSLCKPAQEPIKQKKTDPIREKHIKSSRTISIEPAVKLEPSHPKGMFGRLVLWLYPPVPLPEPQFTYTFDWDRNHYLVLNGYWERYFKSPLFVDALPPARLPSGKSLTPQLERLVGARITRFGGEQPLIVTRIHCQIAASFVTELRDRGLPLLCDGRRKIPRHYRRQAPDYDPAEDSSEDEGENGNEWPKRDADGRVVRCKQDWTAEETLKGVYGLWLIKMHEAEQAKLLERKARKAARKERRESCEMSS